MYDLEMSLTAAQTRKTKFKVLRSKTEQFILKKNTNKLFNKNLFGHERTVYLVFISLIN